MGDGDSEWHCPRPQRSRHLLRSTHASSSELSPSYLSYQVCKHREHYFSQYPLFFFLKTKERKISPQPSPVTCGPGGGSCGFRERRRGPAGRRRRRRRRRPTWRRAGLGRAAATPERPSAVARLAVLTPAPNLARRPRSAQPRSARARPGAGTAQRQRRWARQAPDPQLRCSPAGGARRPEPWNRRRSST